MKSRYVPCVCGKDVFFTADAGVFLQGVCSSCERRVSGWAYPGTLDEMDLWSELGLGEPNRDAWIALLREKGARDICDHEHIDVCHGQVLCMDCGLDFEEESGRHVGA